MYKKALNLDLSSSTIRYDLGVNFYYQAVTVKDIKFREKLLALSREYFQQAVARQPLGIVQ